MRSAISKPIFSGLILIGFIISGCGGSTERLDTSPTFTLPPPVAQTETIPAQMPEAELSAAGPWVLVRGEEGLWAANPDGSGLRYIYPVRLDQLAIGGGHAAFIEETAGHYGSGMTLKMFSLPGGEVQTVTELLSETTEPKPEENTPLDGRIAIQIALQMDNLAWSPDGTQLAFTSAHEGDSADLYLYSPADGKLTRLSEEPGQAFRPIWSLDGNHIIFMEAHSFGTGAGYDMAGVWVACADGSCNQMLYQPHSGDELVAGWLSEDTVIVYSFNALYGFHNLRSVNIETGVMKVLWESSFEEADLDPESGMLLVVVSDLIANYIPEVEAGLYLVDENGAVESVPLVDFFSEDFRPQVSWHQEAGVFLVKLSNEFITLSPAGEIELLVPRIINNPQPVPSPAGDEWLWMDDGQLVLNGPETQLQVLFPADSFPVWGPDGTTVLFVYQGQLVVARLDDLSTSATGDGLIGSLRWMGGE